MILLIVFILGLVGGSFLSVLFTRLTIAGVGKPRKRTRRAKPKSESILFGRSRCDHCKRPIAWYDNVPLVSYLALRSRCRHCGKSIEHFHPVLELSTGLYVLASFLVYGLSVPFAVAVVFGLTLLLLFAYDVRYQIIPNAIVIPALAAAVVLLLVEFGLKVAGYSGPGIGLWSADPGSYLTGGLVIGGFFLALFAVSGGSWIGGGDVKLGALLGLLLGWPYALVALVLAYLIGAVYAAILLAARRADLKTSVPFGPMLIMGFFIAQFLGGSLINWYQGWFL